MMQHEIDQFTHFAVYYLLPVAFLALFFGFIVGWYFRGKYDFDQWLKRGIWCDDCAPLVDRSKD